MNNNKIQHQPEYDALNAFDAAHNVEPFRTIAERLALKYGAGPAHSMVDDIAHALEDAHELGVKRGPLIPKRSFVPGQ
jgi:hypothetical protein